MMLVAQFGVVKLTISVLLELATGGVPVEDRSGAAKAVGLLPGISAVVAGNALLTLFALLRRRVARLPGALAKLVVIKLVVASSVLQRTVVTLLVTGGHLRLPWQFACATPATHGRYAPLDARYGLEQFLSLVVMVEMVAVGLISVWAFSASDVAALPRVPLSPVTAAELAAGDGAGEGGGEGEGAGRGMCADTAAAEGLDDASDGFGTRGARPERAALLGNV